MVKKPREFEIIANIFAPLASAYPGSLNLADDAAILLTEEGRELVVTSDTIVEGVHFLTGDPPYTVGVKALAVNLSDLAAMGAEPLSYTLSAAFSPRTTITWIQSFASGLKKLQDHYQIHLIGGDTVSTPGPLTLTVTAFGSVRVGKLIRRNTANIGDTLYVTGNIGDAALGLRLANNQLSSKLTFDSKSLLVERYQQPTPRIEIGRSLHKYATSAIDISDGLIADIGHIAEQSDRRIIVYTSCLPISDAARTLVESNCELINLILGGGDDYELAFTAPIKAQKEISSLSYETGIKITAIGSVLMEDKSLPRLEIRGEKNEIFNIPSDGYSHF